MFHGATVMLFVELFTFMVLKSIFVYMAISWEIVLWNNTQYYLSFYVLPENNHLKH